MTLADQEARAISWAWDFLVSLTDPKRTPRVPMAIRDDAKRIMRHFPSRGRFLHDHKSAYGGKDCT